MSKGKARRVKLEVSPTVPLDIDIACTTVHVAAYRIWHQAKGTDQWTVIGEGNTADSATDNYATGPHPAGDKIYYWLGVSGPPGSKYEVVVTFSQGGQMVPDGAVVEKGRVSDGGAAALETEVTLR
ncbi:MAG: hypothetical protein ABIL09_06600 [Gemmatimonadota bacterium]